MNDYIKDRYGASPPATEGWYDKGGSLPRADDDRRDADILRSAAAVLRRRDGKQTFVLQVFIRTLEKHADRIAR